MTVQGRVLGTLPYMSPEQAQGREVDHRSDLFSLGAVLYEMLSGQRPFRGETHAALVSSILRDTPPPLDEIRPDIPHHLARIVRHCLEKDPERRTQSAKDVRNELTDLEQEEALDRVTEDEHLERDKERPESRSAWLPWSLSAVALLAALALAAFLFLGRDVDTTAPASRIRSLAVLPFDNLMNDPEQEYFVEGMQDALITDLAGLSDLKVISRTSVMRYRQRESSVPEIAEQLGVDAVVEGAVLRAGDRVRISAQLVGADDRHLWAESYDRDLVDVLELLSDVARAIAEEIELTLTPAELDRLEDPPRIDSELQDLLMRGDFFVNRLSRDGALKAEELYRRAIEIAPDSADAYGRLSGVLFLKGFLWPDENARETIAEAERLARKALEIDPDVAAAHSGLGWIHLRFEWDLEAAERAFTRAVAVDPHEGFGRHGLADCAMIRGDMDESLRQLEIARELDPLSPITVMPVVAHLVFAHRFEEAIESGRRALELFPAFGIVHFWLFEAYWQQDEYEAALVELRNAAGANPGWVDDIERAYRESGPREAMSVAARNLIASQDDPSPYAVATYFARAGDHPSALDWLEKAADQRSASLPHLYADPAFDELRNEPRYEALLRRIGMGVPDGSEG
jgi:TolB-like protein